MLARGFFTGLFALQILSHAASSAQSVVAPSGDAHTEVLFFVASDCTYSDRYFPEMNRLQREFSKRGVVFRWIYPNRNEELSNIHAHQQQFGASPASSALDEDGTIARLARVHITPEAAILVRGNDGHWTTVYHGRIDDRYVHIGVERPHAERHDLENAIEAVLGNKPVPKPGGPAVGCAIMGSGS